MLAINHALIERRLPTLARALDDVDLILVDIGAREEPRREWSLLAPFARLYACEPDVEEAARLRRVLGDSGAWRSVTVIEEAIARDDRGRALHVTGKPGWSSLLEPDQDVGRDFFSGKVTRVVETREVETMSLDQAAVTYGFQGACLLKVDTQGSELEILASGASLLRESVLGIYLETCFQPFYREQSLFAEVDAFLRTREFVLTDLRPTYLRRVGFDSNAYSRRHVVWAHCLYLRNLRLLPADEPSQLVRLLALVLAYEYFDLAAELVSRDPWATTLADTFGHALREEVHGHIRRATAHRLRRASATDSHAVLARAARPCG